VHLAQTRTITAQSHAPATGLERRDRRAGCDRCPTVLSHCVWSSDVQTKLTSKSRGAYPALPSQMAPRQRPSPFHYASSSNPAARHPATQPTIDIDPAAQAHPQVRSASFAEPTTVHQYNLTQSADVTIRITSRAPSTVDHPLLYPDDELKGFVVLSNRGLKGMQRIEVVVSWGPSRQIDRN
jgi:hypothetical protein